MPARTDFNVSPYWDDFQQSNDFYRVLFRPGFAVQARELTTLQTILQNQIEQFGNHMFKEGSIVIPGSVAYDDRYFAIKLQATFGGTAISTYLAQYAAGTHNSVTYAEGAILTGVSSGVTAQVVGYAVTDTTTGDLTAFATSEVVTSDSSATGTIASLTNPEIEYSSGKTIYAEDRAPISRATDQTENIKLIVEF